MTKFIVSVILLTLASAAQARSYFELGFESGGETLFSSSDYFLTAGGGFKFALGVQNEVGDHGDSLSLALGYLADSLDASNGTAEINTVTFDAIYAIPVGSHRFGAGASYHIGPTYKEDLAGNSPLIIDFDDALGLVLQYGYKYSNGFQIVVRITNMDYEVGALRLDASSLGIFLSNGF